MSTVSDSPLAIIIANFMIIPKTNSVVGRREKKWSALGVKYASYVITLEWD